jgi:hypothetical protein
VDHAALHLGLGKGTSNGGPQMHDLIGRSSKAFQVINTVPDFANSIKSIKIKEEPFLDHFRKPIVNPGRLPGGG